VDSALSASFIAPPVDGYAGGMIDLGSIVALTATHKRKTPARVAGRGRYDVSARS
jgi:hypothetical protein